MSTRRELLSSLLAAPLARGMQAASRPNVVFILMDDLRWDELRCMGNPIAETPNIDRLAREGALFRNAFVTTPLCSPSRASFLTGRYAHAHHIYDNKARDAESHKLATFPRTLHAAGYETGFVGKFHMGNDDSPRPGFDYWVSFKGQGTYHNPELNENGKRVPTHGYTTDILSERAVTFLERRHEKPFFLWLAHKAVHPELVQRDDGSIDDPNAGKFIPPDRYKSLYAGIKPARRPNAVSAPKDKPALERKIGNLPPLGPATGTDDEIIRNRLRMTKAVDDGVGQMLHALERTGQLDNTAFIFTSDEGYFFGEHGLSIERRLAYEESARIPLLIRYPKLARAGSRIDCFALGIDIAPTVLEITGVKPEYPMHGKSLLPLLQGETGGWRKSFLIEYFSDTTMPRMVHMGYQALRTQRWKYIRYTDLEGMDELYDLIKDPYEMHNVIREQAAAVPALRRELDGLAGV
jgi:N-acetylglucosamine-6-sulfatase